MLTPRRVARLPTPRAKAFVDDPAASKMGKAADLVEQAVYETMTYYGSPDIHWQRVDHERDPAQNSRGRRLPECSVLSQPRDRATTLHRRKDLVD
jgi:hypothetical protein